MANTAAGLQGKEAVSPSNSYFPDAPNSGESSSSGELGNAGQAKANHGVENRKRGYSGSRANRSLSNASVGSGGVSLGLSLTNSTLFYDIPMVSLIGLTMVAMSTSIDTMCYDIISVRRLI